VGGSHYTRVPPTCLCVTGSASRLVSPAAYLRRLPLAAGAQTGRFFMGNRSDTRKALEKGENVEENRATEYMASSYV
jgi:hypothetical protein